MKTIVFLLAGLCFATAGKAQQKNNEQLPPVRTTDPAPASRQAAVALPIRKADNGARQQAVTVDLPIRKTDMAGNAGSTAASNKASQDNKSGVVLPSATAAPAKAKENQTNKE